jgi:hypothetical protein
LYDFVEFNQRKYKKVIPPERLIFYRDGVSEGELARVKSAELAAIEKAIDEFMSKAPPSSAFKVRERQGGPCLC